MIEKFRKCDSGATAIEYGLIAALIGLAVVAGITGTGNSLGQIWSNNANKIVEAMN